MNQHELPIIKIEFLKRKSLIAIVQNSIKGGDNYLFRNVYGKNEKGEEIDILENGRNSCAAFVSWVLMAIELIKKPHATVEGTEKDLINSGWYPIEEYREGAVLLWSGILGELLGQENIKHRHMGFCVGDGQAISNDSNSGFPRKHHVTYNDSRKVEKIYWHPDLDKG